MIVNVALACIDVLQSQSMHIKKMLSMAHECARLRGFLRGILVYFQISRNLLRLFLTNIDFFREEGGIRDQLRAYWIFKKEMAKVLYRDFLLELMTSRNGNLFLNIIH